MAESWKRRNTIFHQALTKELELKAAALESAVASLKGESKAIMQETLEITRMKAGLGIAEYSLSSTITI